MICDYHVHTYYSDDSKYPMENVIIDAIDRKIDEICFTDHVDYGIKMDPMGMSEREKEGKILNVNYPAYFKEIAALREKYAAKIIIKQGMEFGVQTHTIPEFEALYRKHDFDFIIMSCHQVDNKEFWNQAFQTEKTQQEYNESYYEEILKVMKTYKHYSVLGHLDLINRYDKAGLYPFEKVSEIVTEILKQAIADEKGIEVNTSSFRYGLKDMTPSREILELYRQLGGSIITIGSDSHAPKHLGAHIQDTMNVLKEIGFEYYCTFDKMKPKYHKL